MNVSWVTTCAHASGAGRIRRQPAVGRILPSVNPAAGTNF